MSYNKQYFISYGDDRPMAVERIKKQAESFNTFSTIDVYSNNNIYDDEFKEKYKYVLNQRRGGGYWLWKYYLINKKMKEIKEGEYIIYADAGCQLNPKGIGRYKEYLKMLNDSEFGMISFPIEWNEEAEPKPNNGCTEKCWTTKEIFQYFNIGLDSDIACSNQYAGGILIMQKCKHSLKILEEYGKVMAFDQKLITDYYNTNQASYFKENRHDQSLWSIIRKKYDSIVIDRDESFFYFQKFEGKKTIHNYTDNIERHKYPIWATRKKF